VPDLATNHGSLSDELSGYGDLLELVHNRPPWHADALCKEHPELSWFPSQRSKPARLAPIRAVCRACLAHDDCRAWSLAQGPGLVGVWAALTEADRRAIKRVAKAA
jgi:hypothetical protein